MSPGPVTTKLQMGIASIPGSCLIQTSNQISSETWTTSKQPTDDSWRIMEEGGLLYDSRILGGVAAYKSGFLVVTYWFLISAAICVGIAPWLRWRFSLRTLLIATTLVAVVLGLIVWSIK